MTLAQSLVQQGALERAFGDIDKHFVVERRGAMDAGDDVSDGMVVN